MTPAHQSPFARANDAVHLVGLCFFLSVALAAWAAGAPGAGTGAAVYAGLLAGMAILAGRAAARPSLPKPLGLLHLVAALLVLPVVFSGIRHLMPAATGLAFPLPPPPLTTGRHFDDALAALDLRWFGLDVARWSERVLTPGLADFFMVFYALYFFMPVACLWLHLRRASREDTYRAVFTVSVGIYACYALYLLLPVVGPRHPFVHRSAPLPRGLFCGWAHDFILGLEPQPFDAFPSAHVVMGLLCAVLCWRFGGAARWVMAAVGALTATATVVLRYHYLVDDLVGLLLIAAALGAAAFLARRAARKAKASDHGDRMGELMYGGGHE